MIIMSRRNKSVLWQVFTKTDDLNKKALCLLCDSELSYKTSTGNLKSHLRMRHKEAYRQVSLEQLANGKPSRTQSYSKKKQNYSSKNPLWNYFHPETIYDKTASCNLCKKILSYRTSIGNLKKHLEKHPKLLREYYRKYNNYLDKTKEFSEDQTAFSLQQEHDDSNFSKKFAEEIWGKFEIQESIAHCTLCDKDLENTMEDVKKHLEEDHPSVFNNILNGDIRENTTDEESVQNEADIFTDVMYLDEPELTSTLKRKISNSENNLSMSRETQQEISFFLNYIRVLLRKVNKQTLSKLQVDIINMISSRTD